MVIDENRDTMLRESIINDTSGAIYFGKNLAEYYFNPIMAYNHNFLIKHNTISSNPDSMNTETFTSLLTNTDSNPETTGLQFSFGLVNLLYSENNNIYPFLEYKLGFASPVANRFYTIEGNSLIGNYNVTIIMKKSTNSDSPIGDFTVVF